MAPPTQWPLGLVLLEVLFARDGKMGWVESLSSAGSTHVHGSEVQGGLHILPCRKGVIKVAWGGRWGVRV